MLPHTCLKKFASGSGNSVLIEALSTSSVLLFLGHSLTCTDCSLMMSSPGIAQKRAHLAFSFFAFLASSVIFSPTVSATIMMPLGLVGFTGIPDRHGPLCCGDFLSQPGGAQIICTAF